MAGTIGPTGCLSLVLDQTRPDYVKTFDVPNVRKLMRDGAPFENAYLGHMASETVITHNVITSGQLPRDMGWADEGVCGAPPSVCVGGVPGSFELRH